MRTIEGRSAKEIFSHVFFFTFSDIRYNQLSVNKPIYCLVLIKNLKNLLIIN